MRKFSHLCIGLSSNDPANILKGLRESALYLRNASF